MTEPYPLLWPENEPETPSSQRKRSRFQTTFTSARNGLLDEIAKVGGRDAVITCNLFLRRNDGLPKAGQPEPSNPGVAVYFWRQGKMHCMACDRWNTVKDNLRALELSLNALRGIDRWGATNIRERAIEAFAYLPPGGSTSDNPRTWWNVLGVFPDAPVSEIKAAYRAKLKAAHPDHGGSQEAFHQLQEAYDAALEAQKAYVK